MKEQEGQSGLITGRPVGAKWSFQLPNEDPLLHDWR
jgi:hypothetical protein